MTRPRTRLKSSPCRSARLAILWVKMYARPAPRDGQAEHAAGHGFRPDLLLRQVAGEQNHAHMQPRGVGVFVPGGPDSMNTGGRINPGHLRLSQRLIRGRDAGMVLDMEDERHLSVPSGERLNGGEQRDRESKSGREVSRLVRHVRFPLLYREAENDGEKVNRPEKGLELAGMPTHPAGITQLLVAWGHGDEAALNRMIPLVHLELQQIARRCMREERGGHSLQPTALVNEAYLRLVDVQQMNWQNRAHFLAMAARLMRRILVDHARSKGCDKRGGGAARITLDDALVVPNEPGRDLVALDDALEALAHVDERKSRMIELRFFGGLSVEETAAVFDVSADTVKRDWRLAKAWLLRELRRDEGTRHEAREK